MISRSALFQTGAQSNTPVCLFQAWALRSLMAVTIMAGLVFTGSARLLAQDVPPPPPDQDQQQAPAQDNQQLPQYGAPLPQDNNQAPQQQDANPPQQGQAPAPQGQPLTADQLNQLVAPIALYPDALVAQILAASTYPMQVVEADRWVQAQGNAPADQIAAGANAQQWDPSVKALTAFPSVLSQMDRNLQWTTDLGNAYYNQPQDVMNAVQQMRQRAQQAGTLQSTPQQTVSEDNGDIDIAPANPEVVYVPVYNPWVMYGPPVVAFPGYYYYPPPGVFVGVGFGFRIGFGFGIPVRPWAPWGWGWHSWGCGWHDRTVVYNRTTYITRSTTVINRGFNRPGAPPVQLAGQRGSFMNRPAYAGYANRVASGARPAPVNGFANHPGNNAGNFNNRPVAQPGLNNHVQQPTYRPAPTNGYLNGNRPAPVAPGSNRPAPVFPGNTQRPTYSPAPTYNRPAPTYRPSAPQNYSRPSAPVQSRPAPAPQHQMSAPHSAPAPHGGGGGDHRH
jgi:hypothetical protein